MQGKEVAIVDDNRDAPLSARQSVRQDWPVLALFAASLAAGWVIYPRIQGPVPTHWNYRGEVDAWGSPLFAIFFFPLMTAGVYLLLVYLPAVDPRRASYDRFAPALRLFRWALVAFMVAMQWLMLAPALGLAADQDRAVRVLIGALILVLGNSFGQLRSTFFVGIRTPWTLADDRVWQRTHRIAGRTWVAAGLVGMASGFLGDAAGGIVFGTALGVGVLYPIVFSYLEYQRLHRGS